MLRRRLEGELGSDGRREVIRLKDATGWRDNDRVRVINGNLSLITQ